MHCTGNVGLVISATALLLCLVALFRQCCRGAAPCAYRRAPCSIRLPVGRSSEVSQHCPGKGGGGLDVGAWGAGGQGARGKGQGGSAGRGEVQVGGNGERGEGGKGRREKVQCNCLDALSLKQAPTPLPSFPHFPPHHRQYYEHMHALSLEQGHCANPCPILSPLPFSFHLYRQYYERLDALSLKQGRAPSAREASELQQRLLKEDFPPDVRRCALTCLWFPVERSLAADEDSVYGPAGPGEMLSSAPGAAWRHVSQRHFGGLRFSFLSLPPSVAAADVPTCTLPLLPSGSCSLPPRRCSCSRGLRPRLPAALLPGLPGGLLHPARRTRNHRRRCRVALH